MIKKINNTERLVERLRTEGKVKTFNSPEDVAATLKLNEEMSQVRRESRRKQAESEMSASRTVLTINENKIMEWREVKPVGLMRRMFQLGDEPEVIHVIQSGHMDKYYVLHDDAYERDSGKVEALTAAEVLDKYKINLNRENL